MLLVLIIYNCDFGRKFHEVGVPFGDCLASLRHGLVCTSACKVSHKPNQHDRWQCFFWKSELDALSRQWSNVRTSSWQCLIPEIIMAPVNLWTWNWDGSSQRNMAVRINVWQRRNWSHRMSPNEKACHEVASQTEYKKVSSKSKSQQKSQQICKHNQQKSAARCQKWKNGNAMKWEKCNEIEMKCRLVGI